MHPRERHRNTKIRRQKICRRFVFVISAHRLFRSAWVSRLSLQNVCSLERLRLPVFQGSSAVHWSDLTYNDEPFFDPESNLCVQKSSGNAFLTRRAFSSHVPFTSFLPLSGNGGAIPAPVRLCFLRVRYSSRVTRSPPLDCRLLHPDFRVLRFLVTQSMKRSV